MPGKERIEEPEYAKTTRYFHERLKDSEKIMEGLPENADRAQVQAMLMMGEGLACQASIAVEQTRLIEEIKDQTVQMAYQLEQIVFALRAMNENEIPVQLPSAAKKAREGTV